MSIVFGIVVVVVLKNELVRAFGFEEKESKRRCGRSVSKKEKERRVDECGSIVSGAVGRIE